MKNKEFIFIALVVIFIYLFRRNKDNNILSYDNEELSSIVKNLVGSNQQLVSNASNTSDVRDSVNIIIDEYYGQGYSIVFQLAYILATAKHESKLGEWMEEKGGEAYLKSKYHYTTAKGKELGNRYENDHIDYKGRGFVQLTGRANYQKYEKITGLPLIDNPKMVQEKTVAAFILVHGMMNGTYTQRHELPSFVNYIKQDFFNARKVVNAIGRKGSSSYNATLLIQDYANQFLEELKTRTQQQILIERDERVKSILQLLIKDFSK